MGRPSGGEKALPQGPPGTTTDRDPTFQRHLLGSCFYLWPTQDRSKFCRATGRALLRKKSTNTQLESRPGKGPCKGAPEPRASSASGRAHLVLISSGESSANTAATPSCQPFRKPPPDRWSPSQAPGALGCPQRVQTGCSCLTLPPTHGRAAPEKVDMWWAGLGPLVQLEDILFRDKPHAWGSVWV